MHDDDTVEQVVDAPAEAPATEAVAGSEPAEPAVDELQPSGGGASGNQGNGSGG